MHGQFLSCSACGSNCGGPTTSNCHVAASCRLVRRSWAGTPLKFRKLERRSPQPLRACPTTVENLGLSGGARPSLCGPPDIPGECLTMSGRRKENSPMRHALMAFAASAFLAIFAGCACNDCCNKCRSCHGRPCASHEPAQQPQAGPGGTVSYPYYTLRGPRDFLATHPQSIGP